MFNALQNNSFPINIFASVTCIYLEMNVKDQYIIVKWNISIQIF